MDSNHSTNSAAASTNDTMRFVELPRLAYETQGFSPAEREILDTVNQKVAGAESLERVIDFLFHATRSIWPCDRIAVAFIEEDGSRIVSHYAVADYEPLLLKEGYAGDVRGSSLAEVIRRGAPRIINDLEQYLRIHPESPSTKLVVREGIRSSMTCPLAINGHTIGLMFRSSRRPGAYNDHLARLHGAVAERLSQAVEKTWRIRQLEAANTAYFEMLGFVSHELKSPVASIATDAKLLTEGYLGELSDKQRAKLERVIVKSNYLLGIVREYLDLARIEGGTLAPNFRRVDDFVRTVIDPAVDIIQPQIEEMNVSVERDLPATPVAAHCDPALLTIVMVNLLGNAVKYGNRGGLIRVRAGIEDGHLGVSVWNAGPGFARSKRSSLFKKFSRIDSPELMKRKGTGVGLYTAWRIIQLHGGRITADSEEGEWARFSFRFPQPLPEQAAAEHTAQQ